MTLVAGCADVPTSGLLQHTALPAGAGGAQQGTHCCAVIFNPPARGWGPSQIVQNFLLASADFADHHAIAREYLTAAANRSWQPGPGPAVTVIADPGTRVTPAQQLFGSQGTEVVQISASELGQVSTSGQYIPAEGGQAQLNQAFTLQRVNRQWRIATGYPAAFRARSRRPDSGRASWNAWSSMGKICRWRFSCPRPQKPKAARSAP